MRSDCKSAQTELQIRPSERIKRIGYFWYLYEITVESQCGYIGMTMKY